MDGERCDFCFEGKLRSQQIREYYRFGKNLVVIERVPAHVCEKCGQRYYDAHVAKELRRLAKQGTRAKERISFPLVYFDPMKASA
jgi:YgiT-type zinc finger domain-containing protein